MNLKLSDIMKITFLDGSSKEFENGKEVVLFHSIDEAVDLAGYYLQHDEERQQIAAAGLKKVQNDFKYTDRLKKMISVAL